MKKNTKSCLYLIDVRPNSPTCFCFWPKTESPVWRKEGSGSPSMVTLTSTWFSSQMLVEQEMFILCPSKAQGLGGKPCLETGGRIGKAILTSMGKASLFRSLQVMAGLSLATTLCLLTGNLDKHLKGHSSRNLNDF